MSDPTAKQVGGDHYTKMPIQPERFIYENKIGYHEACAIKYLCRWRAKGGVQDLDKAIHFIELLKANIDRTFTRKLTTGDDDDDAPPPPLPTFDEWLSGRPAYSRGHNLHKESRVGRSPLGISVPDDVFALLPVDRYGDAPSESGLMIYDTLPNTMEHLRNALIRTGKIAS